MLGFKNFISSTINMISNPDTVETYEFEYIYEKKFDEILTNYIKRFDKENLESNNISSCEIIFDNIDNNIHHTKRILTINLLLLPFVIPEYLLQYIGDTFMKIEHTIKIDYMQKMAEISTKNISHPQINFIESSLFLEDNNFTHYSLSSSLSANIMVGINETVRKLWLLQYKLFHDSGKFKKNISG
jgi:hypothetical protein